MASSMLAGDRRCTSTRKSGMTVLGKIPKPINLPSQRLENNGLDPNVEIVPKGTLTWGSRHPATSNAWNSSTLLSPKADRSVGSPSYINDRPSSAESAARPSTAGSDRSNDSARAWGPNSRPSTASGSRASNDTSLATNRPRSAETRPGSSQLSRFAECSAEKTIVHGATRMVEESGPISSLTNGFTLSSGDFPSLGSGKNSGSPSHRGPSSQGRASLCSGMDATPNEVGKAPGGEGNIVATSSHQNVDTMKTDNYSCDEGSSPHLTNLQRGPQQPQPFPSLSAAPHHIDSWRAPSLHAPEGIWYRGGGPGGPYRLPGPSGNFPVDPYICYPPFPPNSEAAPRPAPGLGGYHPKSIEGFHPRFPANSYMVNRPIIPITPGVYPGPVPCDGCYGPPQASFCNAGGREVPSIGMPSQPGVLNQYPTQTGKLNPGQFQTRPSKHDTVLPEELVETDRARGAKQNRNSDVLEQHDSWEDTTEPERKGQPASRGLPYTDGNMPEVIIRGSARQKDSKKDALQKLAPVQRTYQAAANDAEGQSLDSFTKNLQANLKDLDDGILLIRHKGDNSVVHDSQPVIKKNVLLIEKIESLNNKVRSSSPGESFGKMPSDGTAILGFSESQTTTINKPESIDEMAYSHENKRANFSRNRLDHPFKLRPNSLASDLQETVIATNVLDHPDIDVLNSHPSLGNASDELHVAVKEACISSLDPLDYNAQRAKMKEMATQRAKQLQEEEEERTREQKAKALAKLEELNRRSSAQNMKKLSDAQPSLDDMQHKQESGVRSTVRSDAILGEPLVCASCEKPNARVQANESAPDVPNPSSELPLNIVSLSCEALTKLPVILDGPSLSAIEQETSSRESIVQKTNLHSHNGSDSKHKSVGYRRRQIISQEKTLVEKSSALGSTENPKSADDTKIETSNCGSLAHEDPSIEYKKSGRNSRNRKKADETPMSPTLLSFVANQEKVLKAPDNGKNCQPLMEGAQSTLVPAQSSIDGAGYQTLQNASVASSCHESSKATEEAQGKMNNHSKSQLPRRSTRNHQGNRTAEKLHGNEAVIWAPVKPGKQSNKIEQSEAGNLTSLTVYNSDLDNVTRTKRAEMERYVPKPLSKDLSLQIAGVISHAPGLVASIDMSGKHTEDLWSSEKGLDKSNVEKAEFAPDTRKWEVREDNKPTRQGKMHASWRKRNSLEPAMASPSSTAHSSPSDAKTSDEKPSGQLQPQNLDSLPEKQFSSDGWDSNDNNAIPSELINLPVAANEQRAASRQRRQQVKVHRPSKNNHCLADNKDGGSGTADNPPLLSSASDLSQSEQRTVSSSEIKNSGQVHPRPHWKPKSHIHPQNYLQGSSRNERVPLNSEDQSDRAQKHGMNNKRDASSVEGKGDHQYVLDNSGVPSCAADSSGDKSYMAKQDVEHQVSPAPRRQGQHSNRHSKGREAAMYRGSDPDQDAGKQHFRSNHDSRKTRGHFEYHPVGFHCKPMDSFQNDPNTEPSVASYRGGGQH